MLNLSDKELDRFSKEAAQEYEPGDVLGSRSWEKLEVQINTEFGHTGWNPLRYVRRFPFYYAPALLVLVGVIYYLVRPGVSSGSSPGTVKAPIGNVPVEAPTASTPTVAAPAGAAPTEKRSVLPQNSASTDKTTSTPPSSSAAVTTDRGLDGVSTANAAGAAGAARGAGSGGSAGGLTAGAGRSAAALHTGAGRGGRDAADGLSAGAGRSGAGRSGAAGVPGGLVAGAGSGKGIKGHHGSKGGKGVGAQPVDGDDRSVDGTMSAGGAAGVDGVRELSLSVIAKPNNLKKRNAINDSALRAFTLKSTAPALIKNKGGLHINRNLQFGLMIAPDFSSVNSLAGDKAGSSIGVTVDYQFANHWYVGTGILATRKNYAARNQDYHAPPDFYQQNGILGNVSYVKGSFYMMEIPLNLRYDFSVSGSTLFFISGGASSYLMVDENANYYSDRFNQAWCRPVDHLDIKKNYLFCAVNLSAGVETGLTNSLSLLIAPYVKIPSSHMGLGQVQMNSVGINFALKFAPVISRKRH